MRRSGNKEENKRIIMDIEVVLKSHDCPFIVQCLGCFITDADVWICMELMATCFDKLLKRIKRPVPEDVLGKVTVATVKALHYLKEMHGVIHRDVKPSNILLDERGNVKLCDFGISGRLVDSKAKTPGCAAYMAPERIDPPNPTNPDYDIRADVWSLGITLVELASGHFPYTNCKTDFEVLTKVINEDPPMLPADQSFSPEFHNFVSSCLTKNYQKRPKYRKLLKEAFILNYEHKEVDLAQWYASTFEPSVTSTAVQTKSSPSYSNASTNTVSSPTACLSPTYVHASTNTPVTSPIRKYTPSSSGSSMSQASPTPPRRQGVFNHSQFHHRNLSDPRYQEQPVRYQEQAHRYYQQPDQPIYGRSESRAFPHERLHPELPPTIPPRIYPIEQRKRHPSEPQTNGTPPPVYHRHVSPAPPEPPPRRINESMSVPGSPQHGRAAPFRLRYQCTPEPQRRTLPGGAGGGGASDLHEQL